MKSICLLLLLPVTTNCIKLLLIWHKESLILQVSSFLHIYQSQIPRVNILVQSVDFNSSSFNRFFLIEG